MVTFFVATFGVLGLGVVLVVYGTIVKNRWGINLDPVFCPCCHTSLPETRIPQNIRQKLWGGWTCPKCGVEVDKWGREIVSKRSTAQPVGQTPRVRKRKLFTFAAVGYFCLTLLLGWFGVGFLNGPPHTFLGWISFVGEGALEAMIFTALLYLISIRLTSRSVSNRA